MLLQETLFTPAPAVDAANNLTLVGGNPITDISGNGINFFKPTWSATPGVAVILLPFLLLKVITLSLQLILQLQVIHLLTSI